MPCSVIGVDSIDADGGRHDPQYHRQSQIYKKKFVLVYRFRIKRRDRETKHSKCLFVSHEKSYKKIKKKTPFGVS